jgi:IS66 C-terminal element
LGARCRPARGLLYTIVESCSRGLDPLAYLRDVLARLPKTLITEVEELTPESKTARFLELHDRSR